MTSIAVEGAPPAFAGMTSKVRFLEIPFIDPARKWFPEYPSTPLRYAQGERVIRNAQGERFLRNAHGELILRSAQGERFIRSICGPDS